MDLVMGLVLPRTSCMRPVDAAKTGLEKLEKTTFLLIKFILRAKEVAMVNHTFVIELKPDVADLSGFGFEFPEKKIEQASQEIFDGFLEYLKTFLGYKIDSKIVNECKSRIDWIKNIFENQ